MGTTPDGVTGPADPLDTPAPRGRLQRMIGRLTGRKRLGPGAERALLAAVVPVFVVASVLAYRNLPTVEEPRWWLLALTALVGVPVTVGLNAAEYAASARILGHRVGVMETLRVTVLSSAANLLPLPGSVIVRSQRLRALGSTYRHALTSTSIVGLAWVSATCLLAGAANVGRAGPAIALPVIAVGVLAAVAFGVLLRPYRARAPIGSLATQIAAIEVATVLSVAARWYLTIVALGGSIAFGQALALTLATVVASVIGILPGGLGIREAVAAGVGALVGLPAAVGLVGTAVDRVLALVTLACLAAFVTIASARGRREPRERPI